MRILNLFVLAGWCASVNAATYFVAPSGGSDSNNGTSAGTAFATLNKGQSVLNAGDTLTVLNGTYGQLWDIVNRAGTQAQPITIQAQTPYGVTIDGNVGTRTTNSTAQVRLRSSSWVTLTGFRITDAAAYCLFLDGAKYCTVRSNDVSRPRNFINQAVVNDLANCHAIGLSSATLATVSNLVEENIVTYFHRHGIVMDNNGNYNTVRRNYINCMGYRGINPSSQANEGIACYGSSGNLVENNVIHDVFGVGLAVHGSYLAGQNNRFFGNVVRAAANNSMIVNARRSLVNSPAGFVTNTVVKDCVIMDGLNQGFVLWHGQNNFVTNCTSVNNALSGFWITQEDCFWQESPVCSTIRDAELQTTPFWFYLHNLVSQGNQTGFNFDRMVSANPYNSVETSYFTNCTADSNGTNLRIYSGSQVVVNQSGYNTTNPNYNTTTYGKGAYLIGAPGVPGRGATVLYRYVNGTLTGDALWPWPTEAQVQVATGGIGVTYEADGGLFKTLDGLYGAPPPSPVTIELKWHPYFTDIEKRATLFESSATGVGQEIRVVRDSEDTVGDLSGTWTWSGTAVYGQHYTLETGSTSSWTIADGETYVEYTIHPIKDGVFTGTLEIVVTLGTDAGYSITGPNPLYCDRIDKDLEDSTNRDPLVPGQFPVPRRGP